MRSTNLRLAAGAVGLCLGALAGPAAADTQVIPVEVPRQTANWEGDEGPNILLPKHDPALGPLRRVMICLRAQVWRRAQAENLSPGFAQVTITQPDTEFVLRDPANPDETLEGFSVVHQQVDQVLAPFDGFLDMAGPSGVDTEWESTSMVFDIMVSGDALQAYQGTGELLLPVDLIATVQLTGPANLAFGVITEAALRGSVVYVYSPTPAP